MNVSPDSFKKSYLNNESITKDIEINSSTGEKVDYCLVTNFGSVSFFYLGKNTISECIAEMMTDQGFFFVSKKKNIYHFKTEDFNVYIKFGLLRIDALEICRGSIPSNIDSVGNITPEMFEETPDEFVEKYISLCKQNEVSLELTTTSDDNFHVIKQMKNAVIASEGGAEVDYFRCKIKKYSVFGIQSTMKTDELIEIMKEQGFRYVQLHKGKEADQKAVQFENRKFDVYVTLDLIGYNTAKENEKQVKVYEI